MLTATPLLDRQSEGADPSILSNDYDPYLDPGLHPSIHMSENQPEVRSVAHAHLLNHLTCSLPAPIPQVRNRLRALEEKYKDTPKARRPSCATGPS